MADDHIKMTIGAMEGASVKRVFDSIRKQAKSVGKEMSRYLAPRQGIQGLEGYRKAIDRLVQTTKSLTDVSRRQSSEMRSSAQERIREARQLEGVRKRAQDAIHSREMRNIRSEGQLRRREAQRVERRAQRFARMTSHRATRFFWPNAPLGSMARGAAMNIARGIGLNTNTTTALAGAMTERDVARHVSTQAYRPGEAGPAGTRVDPMALRKEFRGIIRNVGTQGGTQGLLEGAAAFVGERGNLQIYRDLASDLAKRSKAFGIDSVSMARQAAKVESALSNQKEYSDEGVRGQAVLDVIDNLIYQGKRGSVEGAELAVQIPKLSGIAGRFEGDTTKAIKELVTVMQLAVKGTANNASVGATFTARFSDQLVARSGLIKKQTGVNIFADDGNLRSLSKIIPELIAATAETKNGKNQMEQLKQAIPNIRAFGALEEMLTIFRGQGGGAEGQAAVERTFREFAGGSVSGDVDAELKVRESDLSTRVEKMNAVFGDVADRFLAKFVPALEKAEPALTKFAEVLGNVATWTLENPKKAIALALGASIARAGVESAVRVGVEAMMLRVAPAMLSAVGSGLVTALGGPMVAAAAAAGVSALFGVIAAAISGFSITDAAIKYFDKDYANNDRTLGQDLGDFWDILRGRGPSQEHAGQEWAATPSGELAAGPVRRGVTTVDRSHREKTTAIADPEMLQILRRNAEASEAISGKLDRMPSGSTSGLSTQHGDPQ